MVELTLMNAQFPYLEKLNPEQRQAVEHLDGPILVLAGAGSGKTRVLTHRVAHLVLAHSIKPGKILAVTFTNKATEEMRQRLQGLLGSKADELWVATFHSSCLRILRRQAAALGYGNDFIVYDDNDSKQLIKQLMKTMAIDPKEFSPKFFASAIDQAKNAFITPEQLLKDARGYKNQMCAEIYDRYQKELRLANAMDFGDLLVNALQLFLEHPRILRQYQEQLSYILVDEFQDTNTIQYRLVKLLSAAHKNLLVVGDDDQSIYAFRGATIENILTFEKDFPGTKTVKLEQNYRSSSVILEAAHAVISKNQSRKAKKLWTEAPAGDLVHTYVAFDEDAEAAFIAREVKKLKKEGIDLKDIAIFYRTNAQSRALEEAFIDHGLPYRIFGGLKFFDRKEIKDVLAYLRLLVSDRDNQAFIRILNTPARGIGAKTLQNLADYAREKSISLWQATVEKANTSGALKNFVELVLDLRITANTSALSKTIEVILERTGYLKKLKDDDNNSNQSRIENLNELQAIARGMEHTGDTPLLVIQNFLDRVSLTSSADLPETANDPEFTGFVSFMTLHLAKGLEFPVVFFTGLEEGLVPHNRSLGSLSEIEEERRLCYVGITRAMRRLYLTRAQRRSMFSAGSAFGSAASSREVCRFVCDVPNDYFTHLSDHFTELETDNDEFFADEFEEQITHSVSPAKPSKTLASLQKKLKLAQSMLTSADSLAGNSSATKKEVTPKKLAKLEDILPGSRIEHPSFGPGIVVSLDNDPGKELANSKVAIQFDQDAHTRKLILGKARLALAEQTN